MKIKKIFIGMTVSCVFSMLFALSNNVKATAVHAQVAVPYISRTWDSTNKVLVETPTTCSSYTTVTDGTTTMSNGWYVVSNDVTVLDRITVTGTVNLILCDGKTLTASGGITVGEDDKIHVYGQTEDLGTICASSDKYDFSPFGGRMKDFGDMYFHGGTIKADALANSSGHAYSSAIGGGMWRNNKGSITIYGGTIEANQNNENYHHGAGIGGGPSSIGEGQPGAVVTIYGGNISAKSSQGAGIGGGTETGNITIWGGNINAVSTDKGAGIGGGTNSNCRSVTINGGSVTAVGGSEGGPGIGSGVGRDTHGTLNVKEGLSVIGSNTGTPSFPADEKTSDEYASARWRYMSVGNFHNHDLSYAADGATITATCSAEDCFLEDSKATLTINAPSELVYDGTAKAATLSSYDASIFTPEEIKYFKGNTEIQAAQVVNAGEYVAKVTSNGVTAEVSFKILQADVGEYTKPDNLTATYGQALSSVELPTCWSWKNPTDLVGNVGNREHVAIYTPSDTNYKPVEDTLTVVVSKANPSYTVPTNLEAIINDKLSDVVLPQGFSWVDGAQVLDQLGKQTYKAKFTPSDTENYNVINNIDIDVNVKWVVTDEDQKDATISIDGSEIAYDSNISVKVEIKTEITTEEKHTTYKEVGKNFIAKNENIACIFDVKLIRTTDGVEEEIQPSDIKEGAIVTISMNVPETLVGKDVRILHIHSANDVSEITDFLKSSNGRTIVISTDKLSQFAFVIQMDDPNADNGFIYGHGFCVGYVALIIDILLVFGVSYYGVFLVLLKKKDGEEITQEGFKAKFDSFNNKLKAKESLITFIALCVGFANFLFDLISLCCHVCPVSIVSFVLSLLIIGGIIFYYVVTRRSGVYIPFEKKVADKTVEIKNKLFKKKK